MTDDAVIEAHFTAMRERFRAGLPSYGARLLAIRNEIALAPGDDAIRRLKAVAHELAGSAGTLGFSEIGETAAALEQAADRVLDGSSEPAIVIMPMRRLIRDVEFSL